MYQVDGIQYYYGMDILWHLYDFICMTIMINDIAI